MSIPRAVVGQSLRVSALLGVDLAGATVVEIRYQPPTGTAEEITATVDDAATGAIHADVTAAALSVVGDWSFWGHAILADGQTVKTYGAKIKVVAEGTVVAP